MERIAVEIIHYQISTKHAAGLRIEPCKLLNTSWTLCAWQVLLAWDCQLYFQYCISMKSFATSFDVDISFTDVFCLRLTDTLGWHKRVLSPRSRIKLQYVTQSLTANLQWTTIGPWLSELYCWTFLLKFNNGVAYVGAPWSVHDVKWNCLIILFVLPWN